MHLLALVVAGLAAVAVVCIVAEAERGAAHPQGRDPDPCWSCFWPCPDAGRRGDRAPVRVAPDRRAGPRAARPAVRHGLLSSATSIVQPARRLPLVGRTSSAWMRTPAWLLTSARSSTRTRVPGGTPQQAPRASSSVWPRLSWALTARK